MHEEKLYTSYFEGVLRCNRISNAYSGLNRILLKDLKEYMKKQLRRFLQMLQLKHINDCFYSFDKMEYKILLLPINRKTKK